MYITTVSNRGYPPTVLLRRSYRENGKVKNETIANLTKWPQDKVEGLRKILKGELDSLATQPEIGRNFGLLFFLKQVASKLGITRALGRSRNGTLSLFLVLARIAKYGSRLSSVRWSKEVCVKEILGLEEFDENDLYEALDWLSSHQEQIEMKLFNHYKESNSHPISLLLYDVTSSYFEGLKNELAEFGYNRDKKKGKKQIVIGLLTDYAGEPLAGNTSDPSTVYEQIELVRHKFDIDKVIFVGDKGMIKSQGKASINAEDWQYITTLNKMEIQKFIKENIIQYDLFEKDLCEITLENKRYILRRNEQITHHLQRERNNRLSKLQRKINERNEYVKTHPRAIPETALKTFKKIAKEWRLDKFIELTIKGKEIQCEVDSKKQAESFKLDGCVVIETDVKPEDMSKENVNIAYKNLYKVEKCFRNMKTELLNLRPIFVRKSNRTKAHVFLSMLGLKIASYIDKHWKQYSGTTHVNPYTYTLEEILLQLNKINFLQYQVKGNTIIKLPKITKEQAEIFAALNCKVPTTATV